MKYNKIKTTWEIKKSKHKGWIYLVSFDGEKTIAHSNWAEHGFCELHVKK